MSLQRKLIIYSADIHLNFFRKIDYRNYVHVFILYVPTLYLTLVKENKLSNKHFIIIINGNQWPLHTYVGIFLRSFKVSLNFLNKLNSMYTGIYLLKFF